MHSVSLSQRSVFKLVYSVFVLEFCVGLFNTNYELHKPDGLSVISVRIPGVLSDDLLEMFDCSITE